MIDAKRGPVFRTVHPDTLSERTEEGPTDRALHLLIWGMRPPRFTAPHAAEQPAVGSRPGHARGSMYRTKGK